MKSIIVIAFVILSGYRVSAQNQVELYMKEAKEFLDQKNYQQAQLSLQDAINELNNLMAMDIAAAMPNEVNGLVATGDGDVSTMGMMGGGATISKSYQHPTKQENSADVVIMANSPMMASMNMYMSNPGMMGPEYKSVKVGTRRAILKSEKDTYYGDDNKNMEIRSSELQIPLTQTLITINLRGFASEAEELAFANKLDIEKLKALLGE